MKSGVIPNSPILAAALVAIPAAGVADVSALDVWNSWKSSLESTGQTVSVGSQSSDGGTLLLNDVNLSLVFPDGTVSGTLAQLEFKERGDGTVAVTLPPDLPISISATPKDGPATDMAFVFSQAGASIVASGDPSEIVYDYLVGEAGAKVDKLVVDGEEIDLTLGLKMNDVDGQYVITSGDPKEINSQFGASSISFEFAATEPGGQSAASGKGEIQNISSQSTISVPADFDSADPVAPFKNGFSAEGFYETSVTDYTFEVRDQGDNITNVAVHSDGGSVDFAIKDGSIAYGGSARGPSYKVNSSQLPFPDLTARFDELAFRVAMPMVKTDEPRDFGFLVKLAGLAVDDRLWAMVDPGQALSHDPATLVIDVSGAIRWLFDIVDPAQAEQAAASKDLPAELHSLSAKDITLSLAGAELTANGDFTFDNSDKQTFGGMPAPSGTLNAKIVGANKLLDGLVAMGIFKADDANGMRAMLGMFTRPGGGEDTLTSEIQVNPDGSILANGQPLQ